MFVLFVLEKVRMVEVARVVRVMVRWSGGMYDVERCLEYASQ